MASPASLSNLCLKCRHRLQHSLRQTIPSRRQNIRTFSTTHSRHHNNPAAPQYEPRGLGDFYNDLLATPLPKVAQAKSEKPLPDWVASGGRKDIEERARKLFGSIDGSGYERSTSDTPDATWRTINGVPVPPRPAEPENCCMSGCVHCVWDDYRDDVESWAVRLREAQAKGGGGDGGLTKTPKVELPRAEVSAAEGSMDDDGGGSEGLWQAPSADADADSLFQEIPVGIREFMATEKRIRERKRGKKRAMEKVR